MSDPADGSVSEVPQETTEPVVETESEPDVPEEGGNLTIETVDSDNNEA